MKRRVVTQPRPNERGGRWREVSRWNKGAWAWPGGGYEVMATKVG